MEPCCASKHSNSQESPLLPIGLDHTHKYSLLAHYFLIKYNDIIISGLFFLAFVLSFVLLLRSPARDVGLEWRKRSQVYFLLRFGSHHE